MKIDKHGKKWRIRKTYKGIPYTILLDEKPTIREAEQLLAAEIDKGSVVGTPSDSFQKAAERYFALKSNILSPWTINGYKTILRALSDGFKATKLTDIDGIVVQKEINDYSRSHSPKSTRNAHGFISAVLGTYKPQLKLYTTLPQKAKIDYTTPSDDDVQRIIDAVAGTRYEIPYRLAIFGLRRGEICAITSADLDGNALTINKTKVFDPNQKAYIIRDIPKTTESIRTVYIDDVLADLIRAKDGPVYDGDPHRLGKKLTEIQESLGIQHFRFHDFRAYFATKSESLGIPKKSTLATGGWSSDRIFDRVYNRKLENEKAAANQIFAEAVFKKS